MKEIPIKKFGTKLMIKGKSINNIPTEYLQFSQNARIYDGGIGPRRGKQLLTSSILGTNNKGGFMLNDKLYQIANSKIYEINQQDGTQTEIATLGYDSPVDVIVYTFPKGTFNSLGTFTTSYDYTVNIGRLLYNQNGLRIDHQTSSGITYGNNSLGVDNRSYNYPAIRIWYTGTTGGTEAGTGRDDGTGTGYYLEDGQYMNLNSIQDTGDIKYDVGYFSSVSKVIIASYGKPVQVFDGQTLSTPSTQPGYNNGIIENIRGFSFLTSNNILYISRPITTTNPEYSYDWKNSGSQQLIFDSNIKGLKATMNGLYIFTEKKVEFLSANSLQNVAGSATFISTPLGESSYPINNLCIAASGDKIFYISKSLQVQTINFIQGTAYSTIGELSARPIINIKEILNDFDTTQNSAFAFYNEHDKTIQFHLRTIGSPFNDRVLIYDMVNDTWNLDTGKSYNYLVKNGETYYGFSDINSSIYIDDVGFSDNGIAIDFKIITQDINLGTITHKMRGGFSTAGGIGSGTTLGFNVFVDDESVFLDYLTGGVDVVGNVGEIGGIEIGGDMIGGDNYYQNVLIPFDRTADEGRIYQSGKRMRLEVTCNSDIQDFILDLLTVRAEGANFIDISDKF